MPFDVSHKSNSRYILCGCGTEQNVLVSYAVFNTPLSASAPKSVCPATLAGQAIIPSFLASLSLLTAQDKAWGSMLYGNRAGRNLGTISHCQMLYFHRLKKPEAQLGFKSCPELYTDQASELESVRYSLFSETARRPFSTDLPCFCTVCKHRHWRSVLNYLFKDIYAADSLERDGLSLQSKEEVLSSITKTMPLSGAKGRPARCPLQTFKLPRLRVPLLKRKPLSIQVSPSPLHITPWEPGFSEPVRTLIICLLLLL